MTLFSQALLDTFEESVRPVNEAKLLPPLLYTSPEFFEFEREAIFGQEWLCVGRADQVKEPGDFRTISMAGEPLILVRDKDGSIKVLSAVCRHRGMVLAEGSGHVKSFLCPYHHWVYATDGRLIGCPEMEQAKDFAKSGYGLPSLPVQVWQGFVFTTFSNDPPPLAPALEKALPILQPFDLDHAVTLDGGTLPGLRWNWKVMLENFNDPYHASRLHGPLQTFAPSHMNEFLPWNEDDGAVVRIQHFTDVDGSFNPTKKCLLPVFPGLTLEQRKRGSFMLLPPTLALAVVPDEVAYFIISPQGPGEISIHIGYCFHPSALEEPLFDLLFEQAKAGVNNFNVQDVHADEMVQVGLNSRFAPRGRYSWQEETLAQFNRWLVKRYRERWPASTQPVLAGT